MSLNYYGPIGNTMSRLAGLKNVRPRRVMPGAEFIEQLAPPDDNVEGTAQPLPNFSNFRTPEPNHPGPDMGGELTAQSYDVRANSAEPMEQNTDRGFLRRTGQALSNYINPQKREEMSIQNKSLLNKAQNPPIGTSQVDMQEGLPPVTAQQEEPMQPRNGAIEDIQDISG